MPFSVFFFTAIVTYCITAFTIPIAIRFGLVDDPQKRKHPANTHEGILPRAGGVAIFTGMVISILLFLPLSKIVTGILLACTLTVFIGILDDIYDISPYLRFAGNIIVASILVMFGLGIPYISNPFGGVIHLDSYYLTVDLLGRHDYLVVSNIFAIVWIVAITNFVNWSKGVDGQLPGFVAISAIILGILAARFTAHEIASGEIVMVSFIVAGAFAGFIPHNFFPQKIMPGYSGGALAGLMLGVLSILSWGKLGTLLLVLSVPFVDAVYVMMRRILSLKSPFMGDAGHFHHRLMGIGWGKRRIAVFYWIVSFCFGISALILPSREKLYSLVLVFVVLAGFILITSRIKQVES